MRGAYKLHPFLEEKAETKIRLCMHEGCGEEAPYPAPKSPKRLQDRYWFCLAHVKTYNASWNYYAQMDEEEIETSRREDTTWGRPSWPFSHARFSYDIPSLDDVESLFAQGHQRNAGAISIINVEESQALAVMDLSYPLTQDMLKTRYKMLAKRFHPDLNQGCRQAEEHLKNINHAYSVLQKFLRRLTPPSTTL
jgi:hypothetical protein